MPPKNNSANSKSIRIVTLGSLHNCLSDALKSTVGSRMQHNETIRHKILKIHRYCIVPSYNCLKKYHATKTRDEKGKKKEKVIRNKRDEKVQKILKALKHSTICQTRSSAREMSLPHRLSRTGLCADRCR